MCAQSIIYDNNVDSRIQFQHDPSIILLYILNDFHGFFRLMGDTKIKRLLHFTIYRISSKRRIRLN